MQSSVDRLTLREPPASGRGRAAAFATGAVLPLAFAPFHAFPLAVICLAVLWWLWEDQHPREAAWRGFWFGFGTFLTGTYWLYTSLHTFGGAPLFVALPLMLSLMAFMACYPALLGYAAARWLAAPAAWRWMLVLPAGWGLTEWLRGWVLGGFPWLSLGYSQTGFPLGGIAPVLGVFGVSLAVAVSAGAMLTLCLRPGRCRLAAAAVLVSVWAGGWVLTGVSWTRPSSAPLTVSLVQGAVPQDQKWLPGQLQPTMQLYRDLTLPYLDSDIIVWPEAAIPALRIRLAGFFADLERLGNESGADFIIGAADYRDDLDQYLNSMITLGSDGGRYYKRHLVPFGEFFPVPDFVRNWMRLMSLPHRDYSPGSDDQVPLRVAGQSVAASICYEDVFGEELLAMLPAASLLVNVTNDAWFGGSVAPHQHLQIARTRALETGRYLMRATNNGITALIGPDGGVRARSAQFEPNVLRGEVLPHSGATPYVNWANWPVVLFCLVVVAATLIRRQN